LHSELAVLVPAELVLAGLQGQRSLLERLVLGHLQVDALAALAVAPAVSPVASQLRVRLWLVPWL